jgi:ABC-type Fe3+-hydroxamate transport system substrate-binding protein
LLLTILLLALFAAAGCRAPAAEPQASARIEIIDDAGHAVRLTGPAHRVVSLIPARTDAILALGGADRLIARTQYDEDPRIAHLPSTGNALNPSVEWIAAQRPDLVVVWPDEQSRSVVTRLVELGIPVYASRVQTLADVRRAIGQLGELLGERARADSLLRAIERDHERVRTAVAERPPPDVLYLIGVDPVMVAGPGTFIDELIALAGGRNLFSDSNAMWPQVSLEEIVRRDPDVIVIGSSEVARGTFRSRYGALPGWRETAAVRSGRVYEVEASSFNRPGPSAGPAALTLAALLHPDAIPEER